MWAWVLRNPLASALGLALVASLAFGGWQFYWRGKAENDLAEQKLKILTDANDAWKELNDKQLDFLKKAAEAVDRVERVTQAAEASNTTFKKQVNSNANSKTPLSPADLSDLSLLVQRRTDSLQTGGSPVPVGRSPPSVSPPR